MRIAGVRRWSIPHSMWGKRTVFVALVASGMLLVATGAVSGQTDAPVIRILEVEGRIDQVTERYVGRSIDAAVDDNVELIVVTLDTPGGTLDSTRDIVTHILESDVPVVVFVSPEGAQAASAGTFISAAAGLLAMAPATNIGAASPVDGSGNDLPPTLANKVTQDTAALIRSVAEERGRNIAALEETVTRAVSYSANEALEIGIADLIARDLDELLSLINGRNIPAHQRAVQVNTRDASIEEIAVPLFDRLISFLANPNVAFLLISLGTVGLIVELWNPGTWIPGSLGLAMMVLGWVGVGNIDFSWAGVIFLALAILLFILEGQAPGVSYFGVAGVVALVIGGALLAGRFADPNLPGGVQVVSFWLLGILGAVILASVLWLSYQVRQTTKSPGWVSEGASNTLIGKEAVVSHDLDPKGEVHLAGEYWSAELQDGSFAGEVSVVAKGQLVRVVGIDGVHLFVVPIARESDETSDVT